MDKLENSPYFSWLESVIRDIVENEPVAVSIETVYKDGRAASRFYNVDRGDRALMMAAMMEAQVMETLEDNRGKVLEILGIEVEDGEDDDPDSPPDDTAYQPESRA